MRKRNTTFEQKFDILVDEITNEENLNIKLFEIGKTLGIGTFGMVKQVHYKNSPQKMSMALKMLKKSEIVKLRQVDHIKSENSILRKIKHPFIVRMIESFDDSKFVYMLFEFVAGGELFRRLRAEGRFSEDVVLFYGGQILLALRYLHLKDIVYRDLKPENLLLDAKGNIKLADFGFAKVLKKKRTYTLCGTPEYLAPEIIKGEQVGYGKSVDWWALGILFYEMLVG